MLLRYGLINDRTVSVRPAVIIMIITIVVS
jgi:hypothetical protein